MANNQYVNKVVFGAVSIIDITPTTAVESDVAQGKVFFKADGSQATGTNQGGSEDGSVTQDADGYLVLSDEPGTHVEVESLSVTQNGTYTAPTGTAYSPVVVNVPSLEPTGIKYVYSDIDGQGAWDVSGYAKCSFDYAPIRDNKARLWLKLTDNLSVSIKINIYSTTGVVDWGDGIQEEWTASPLSHTYSTSGLYVVEIQPTDGQMYFDLDNDVIGQTASNHDTRIVGAEFYSSNYSSTRYAFRYCDNLKKVSFIGAKIKNVGTGACTSCQSLEYVEIPPTITTIQTGAFRYCSSLRKFTIPASVTTVQGYAFDSCTSLEEVHVLPLTPPTLETYVFNNTSPDLKIYVPSASLSAYQSATNWSDYASKMVGE